MQAAKQSCIDRNSDFHSVFVRQYCLSYGTDLSVEGWSETETLFGWRILHCPKLQCAELQDCNGLTVGWLLGVAIDSGGRAISRNTHRFPVALADSDFWEVVEREISEFAGRYVVVLVTQNAKRMYFDPVMDLPAVFNRRERLVASSPLLAATRKSTVNHRIDRTGVIKNGGNYGLTQTCYSDVRRAISNHYLDLDSFSLHRHWPHESDNFEDDDIDLDEVATKIALRLGHIVGQLVENFDCLLPLSGGADSRTLAYSAKSKIHGVKGAFSHRINQISKFDCYIGKMVANDLGIGEKFEIIDAQSYVKSRKFNAKMLRRARWDACHRTGFFRIGSDYITAAENLLPDADYVMRGNILDMTRANQWASSEQFELAHGIGKLNIGGRSPAENVDYWGPEYLNWVDTLPLTAKGRIYDFAFVEQLLPNTLGGAMIGKRNADYINPFNDRSMIKMCMQVHPMKRRRGQLNAALHRAVGVPSIPMTGQIKRDETVRVEVNKLFN